MPRAHSAATYPSDDNPFGPYNYFGVLITRNLDLKVHQRKTYSLLDWLGDVGGFLDGLYLIAELFLAA